jgi:hypothetical protein
MIYSAAIRRRHTDTRETTAARISGHIFFFALVRRLSNLVFEMSQNGIPDFGMA